MNSFLHHDDYPKTIALLDALLLTRPLSGYVVEDFGRSIDWDVVARCVSSTECAYLRAVEAMCRREQFGGLPSDYPWSGPFHEYVASVTAQR